jgi:hypothetical protein
VLTLPDGRQGIAAFPILFPARVFTGVFISAVFRFLPFSGL